MRVRAYTLGMLLIVLAIILGIGFSVLATQNTGAVTVDLFGQIMLLPLYMVAGATFLAGILVAWVFHIFGMLSARLKIHNREGALQDVATQNKQLEQEIESLRLENAQLTERVGASQAEAREAKIHEKKAQVRGFFGRVKESLT